MKQYRMDDPEKSLEEIDVMEALRAINWNTRTKILIEFPFTIYDVPVLTGVGNRIENPEYPYRSTQRYAWEGSPHDKRIPRFADGILFVRYMRRKYTIRAYRRTHKSGFMSVCFKAELLPNEEQNE